MAAVDRFGFDLRQTIRADVDFNDFISNVVKHAPMERRRSAISVFERAIPVNVEPLNFLDIFKHVLPDLPVPFDRVDTLFRLAMEVLIYETDAEIHPGTHDVDVILDVQHYGLWSKKPNP